MEKIGFLCGFSAAEGLSAAAERQAPMGQEIQQ
jgi:hypothetical protein